LLARAASGPSGNIGVAGAVHPAASRVECRNQGTT